MKRRSPWVSPAEAMAFARSDETHLAVAQAAGCPKWYNAAAADIAKVKAGRREGANLFGNHRRGKRVAAPEGFRQILRCDTGGRSGPLCGALAASLRSATAANSPSPRPPVRALVPAPCLYCRIAAVTR